jgi:hypothetical protein
VEVPCTSHFELAVLQYGLAHVVVRLVANAEDLLGLVKVLSVLEFGGVGNEGVALVLKITHAALNTCHDVLRVFWVEPLELLRR